MKNQKNKIIKNEKVVLGYKSYSFAIVEVISYLILLTIISISIYNSIKQEDQRLLGIAILFSLLMLVIIYGYRFSFKSPKVIIESDTFGIYLNYSKKKKVYILYKDIISVSNDHLRGRVITYKSGFITIYTKNKDYKIGIIKDVDKVYKSIEKKTNQFERLRSYNTLYTISQYKK